MNRLRYLPIEKGCDLGEKDSLHRMNEDAFTCRCLRWSLAKKEREEETLLQVLARARARSAQWPTFQVKPRSNSSREYYTPLLVLTRRFAGSEEC